MEPCRGWRRPVRLRARCVCGQPRWEGQSVGKDTLRDHAGPCRAREAGLCPQGLSTSGQPHSGTRCQLFCLPGDRALVIRSHSSVLGDPREAHSEAGG